MILGAILTCACGASPVSTASHASPSSVPSAAAAPGQLSCRLPVAGFGISPTKIQSENGATQPGQQGTGGFLDLPSGKFTPEPSSDTSYLAGSGLWLPVPLEAVSPDRSSYVVGRTPQVSTTPPTTTLYVVEIPSKAERKVLTAPDGRVAFVLAYTSRGIYVETTASTGGGQIDLTLVDPVTGSSRSVPGSQPEAGSIQQAFVAISGDFAWAMVVGGSPSQPSYSLVRLSLSDGSVTRWYSAPGPFFVIGFDSYGVPIVALMTTSAATSQTAVAVIPRPNHVESVQIKGGTFLPGRGLGVTDAHGTWFGGGDGGIWLYTAGQGLDQVATVPPQPGGTGQPYDQHAWRSVAGPCV
jgi:hypothetical protein